MTVETVDGGNGTGVGRVRVTPQVTDVGGTRAVIRVSDGVFWCDRPLDIQVLPLLRMNAPSDIVITYRASAYQSLSAECHTGRALTFFLVSGPSFVTVWKDGAGTYGLSAVPARGDIGAWNVTVGVNDGVIGDQRTLRVQVVPDGTNSPPVAVDEEPASSPSLSLEQQIESLRAQHRAELERILRDLDDLTRSIRSRL